MKLKIFDLLGGLEYVKKFLKNIIKNKRMKRNVLFK